VPVTADFINARLGFSLSPEDIKVILEHVEFQVAIEGNKLSVTAPFWRTDIETREDVVEEVGRLYGFDKLPLELPRRSVAPVQKDTTLTQKAVLRAELSRAGANEVLTYSFVHGDLFAKVGQDMMHAFKLSNALSPDLQYYRLSLTPSLLDKVHINIKAGYGQFALFEMGRTHFRDEWDQVEPTIPNEDEHLAFIIAQDDKHAPDGAAYYQARKYLQQVLGGAVGDLVPMQDFDFATDEWGRQLTAPYEPKRSALIIKDKMIWGVVGEFTSSVRRALKLPRYTAGFEVHLDAIAGKSHAYVSLPRFPEVVQDLTLRTPSAVSYATLRKLVWDELGKVQPEHSLPTLGPLGLYQAEGDAEHRNITLRFALANYDRTLTDAEVATMLDAAATAAKDKLGAERV
ncbi:hypothetical protein KDA23_06020, partial [Candidatus Saccharibacteria bacterium]|nr:hypothetical protein [Candidatus Saccharibacteria bacterium]